MLEVFKYITSLNVECNKLYQLNKIEDKKNRIAEIDTLLDSNVVWSDDLIASSSKLMKEKVVLKECVDRFESILNDLDFVSSFSTDDSLVTDPALVSEIENIIQRVDVQLKKLKTESLFSDEMDFSDAFIEINAGAGGVDSQDWASMLLRMYLMWCDKSGFKAELVDKCDGEAAGIKSATIAINGRFAFGLLKNEIGIHRLVRISPFNANDKRQTSFAGVFCYPAVSSDIDVKLDLKDVRIDVYRSSGAGGQHVNKTESAVRMTHIPTGIVVQSQVQRSQIQNRENCIKMLHAKLYDLAKSKNNAAFVAAEDNKADISWGNQIRNYILHPYKLIKDLRSGFETSNVNAILNGELDDLLNSVLIFKAESH